MTQDRSNARRFLDAFNGIEQLLRDRSRVDDSFAFVRLLEISKEVVPMQRDKLRQMARLRNAIVHNPYDDANEPVADPRTKSVEFLEKQLEVIERPPLVLSVLKLSKPIVLSPEDDISRFLELVQPPDDFSQAPVRLDGQLALITTNAVARWVSSHYEQTEGGGVLPQADLMEVLRFAEAGDRIEVRSRHLKVVQALHLFAGEKAEPPAAIVITQSGLPSETPLGLCTKADVPALFRALGF